MQWLQMQISADGAFDLRNKKVIKQESHYQSRFIKLYFTNLNSVAPMKFSIIIKYNKNKLWNRKFILN